MSEEGSTLRYDIEGDGVTEMKELEGTHWTRIAYVGERSLTAQTGYPGDVSRRLLHTSTTTNREITIPTIHRCARKTNFSPRSEEYSPYRTDQDESNFERDTSEVEPFRQRCTHVRGTATCNTSPSLATSTETPVDVRRGRRHDANQPPFITTRTAYKKGKSRRRTGRSRGVKCSGSTCAGAGLLSQGGGHCRRTACSRTSRGRASRANRRRRRGKTAMRNRDCKQKVQTTHLLDAGLRCTASADGNAHR